MGINRFAIYYVIIEIFTMELLRYEIKAGVFKGVLFGVRHYPFEDEQIYEEDIVVYFGIFQLVITKIYRK